MGIIRVTVWVIGVIKDVIFVMVGACSCGWGSSVAFVNTSTDARGSTSAH